VPSVDNRVVSMEFDNAAFERKVATTIESLGQLQKALDFSGSKKGLEDLGSATKGFNMDTIGEAAEGIGKKFLAMSTIAITALANITSKVIDTGIAMVKHMSLDNIIDGFHEYETNINSIQTIMANTASKGTSLQDVNTALDQLNEYSDKTIYNFSEMARNIGTFTAAGVDLDTSVASIKGIANVAAMSGSNSQQAATAMYQLSQAIATGSVKLMDWNSVVNAGMGGEVFQKALFETGKALHTIKDVPMGQTFEQWKDAGNSFRGSLEEGWLTAEVLTNTLQGFTGDLTEAQLMSMGYTQAQAAEMMKLGQIASGAATEIKTFSQLMGAVKESIGSGWSESFRIIIGDFEEAKALFTDAGNAIGEFVKKSSDSRNALLQSWKDMGGRTVLIEGLKSAIHGLGTILKPIGEAFRDIFPPLTAERLFELTNKFKELADKIAISGETANKIKSIFHGFFSALSIGWEIIKELASMIGSLISSLSGTGEGVLGFGAKIGDFIANLKTSLVDGGGIKDFFDGLEETIRHPVQAFQDLKEKVQNFLSNYDFGNFQGVIDLIVDVKNKIVDFFGGIGDSEAGGVAGAAIDRLGARFEGLRTVIDKLKDIWDKVKPALMKIVDVLDEVWDAIKKWFGELGTKIAEAIKPADFDPAVDAVNVGLLGGIALLLKKMLDEGINFDWGGIGDSISGLFDELGNTLEAFQTKLKADALLKIAGAIALLTASVVVLSLIDSGALTKALTAMTVGFGQLLGSMFLLNKIGSTGFSLGNIAASLLILAGAIMILAFAVKLLGGMSWSELATGLTGVLAILVMMVATAKLLEGSSGGMIKAGIGLGFMATALLVLAAATKIFSMMSWGDILHGLGGIALALVAIAGGMQLMPKDMLSKGAGLLLIGAALNLIGMAMKQMGDLSWGEIAKGMVGIGGALVVIAIAMNMMPNLLMMGAGLVLVGVALKLIASALTTMGGMSWGEIAKGLVALAGGLLILAVAAYAMEGALPGAAAMIVMAVAIKLIAGVIKELGQLSWGDILKGLVGIAAALLVFAAAAALLSPIIPAMLALGASMLLLGAGFALIGVGAYMIAEAFEIMARAGEKGAKGITAALEAIGGALPALFVGLGKGLVQMMEVLFAAAPILVQGLIKILGMLLDGLTQLIPKVLVIIGQLISGIIELIRTKYPELILAGLDLLMSLLKGIRDNIGELVTVVGEIITNFLDALAVQIPSIITSVVNLFTEIWLGVAEGLGKIAGTLLFGTGIAFLTGLIDGVTSAAPGLTSWFTDLAGNVISWIGNVLSTLWQKGTDFITGLFRGVTEKVVEVTTWFGNLAGAVFGWIGSVVNTLTSKGTDFISGLISGITSKATEVTSWFQGLASAVIGWIGDTASTLWDKGWGLIDGLRKGAENAWNSLTSWVGSLGGRVVSAIGNLSNTLYNIGKDLINGLWNGMKAVWDNVSGWLGGLANKITSLKGPPEKDKVILVENGMLIMQGLHKGMASEWENVATWLSNVDPASELDKNLSDRMAGVMANLMNEIMSQLNDMDEFTPTITPVLDLTQVQADASKFAQMLSDNGLLGASLSTTTANAISQAEQARTAPTTEDVQSTGPQEIKFEQNIYAPTELSTNDIYRATRNQIALAQEELAIP